MTRAGGRPGRDPEPLEDDRVPADELDDAEPDETDGDPDDAVGQAATGRRAPKRSRLDSLYEGNGGLDIIGRTKT